MSSKYPDVLIIGGGIGGTSLAYYCAKEGLSVSIIEKRYLASGTSGANQGNISIHTRTSGIFLDLNVECLPMFRTLKDELDFDIGFEEVSGFLVTEKLEHLETLHERVRQLNEKGLNAHFLSAEELLSSEPRLSKNIKGGLFCQQSARIYSPWLVVGFAQAAKRLGTKIYTRTKVLHIKCGEGKFQEVQTNEGVFRAGMVVIAAGTASKAVAKTAGIALPVELFRGQLLVTEPTAEVGNHLIHELETADDKNSLNVDDPLYRHQIRLVFSREKSGNCLIGRSSEPVWGDHCETTSQVIKTLCRNACKFIPPLAHVSLIRTFAGIRAISSDDLPILGPIEGIQGLFFSAAHGDKGVNTSPIIGKLLASYITTGKEPTLLKPFSAGRFARIREGMNEK